MLNFLRKTFGFNHPLRLSWHRLKAILAVLIYAYPARNLKVIGITGTNGKTTTTHMVEHLLRSAGKKVGMASTSEFVINGRRRVNDSKKTTLSPFATQKFLAECRKAGLEYVVIESSSHALHQSRLWGIPFFAAAITNITHEHLDYHGDMDHYAAAKRLLFEMVAQNRKCKERTFVLNAADHYYDFFNLLDCPNKINFSLNSKGLSASDLVVGPAGTHFKLSYNGNETKAHLPMTGDFNVENALAACGVALACNIDLKDIAHHLGSFKGVPGRMERIKSSEGFEVLVDFALTPDALERLYSTLRASANGRLIGIIGSCGDRDQSKRPVMGKIVADYSDITIVTDEEPYTEDPLKIMQAILEGAKEKATLNKDLFLIEDRKAAIEFAVKQAQKGDLIVLTGMGSFTTRTMNDGPISWDDREEARKALKI